MPERFLPRGLGVVLIALASAGVAVADEIEEIVEFEGQPVQGGLLIGHAPAGSSVRIDGESVMVDETGRFLLGFAREATEAVDVEVDLPSGRQLERRLTPEPREFEVQRIDGLPEDQVTPPESVLERIRADARAARDARRRRDARSDWSGGFRWPLIGPVTGVYGSQRILNGQPRNPHWGIDIAAPTGTPVVAPAPGVVSLVHSDMYFSGGTLFIDHGHGLVSAFLHLETIDVEPGERVAAGERIGSVGATGRATGPHLDWRINLGDIRVDPGLLVDWSENPHAEAP